VGETLQPTLHGHPLLGILVRSLQSRAGNRAVSELLDRSSGAPVPDELRLRVETRLGDDFSSVRVHAGLEAGHVTDALGARALATGESVVLGKGESVRDEHLLGHELAHIAQQREGRAAGLDGLGGDEGLRASLEQEASSDAPVSAAQGRPGADGAAAPIQLQEQDNEEGFIRVRNLKLLAGKSRPRMPDWVPAEVQAKVNDGSFETGVHILPYTWPGGYKAQLIVQASSGGGVGRIYRFYRLYPVETKFWVRYTRGDEWAARALSEKQEQRNRDMIYMIKEKGYPAELAEAELDYIDEQVFKALIGAFATELALGSGISSIGSMARQGETGAGRLAPGEKSESMTQQYGKQLEEEGEAFEATAPKRPAATTTGPQPQQPAAPTAAPPTPSPTLRQRASSWFHKPTVKADTNLPPGVKGETNRRGGDITYDPHQTPDQILETVDHETVHSVLSPRFKPGMEFRARVTDLGYENSQFLRWLEEALAEGFARTRQVGLKQGALDGITFPFRGNYQLQLSRVIGEGVVGTVAYGGILYGVYVVAEGTSDPPAPGAP
jgi:hypothetical protein